MSLMIDTVSSHGTREPGGWRGPEEIALEKSWATHEGTTEAGRDASIGSGRDRVKIEGGRRCSGLGDQVNIKD